MEEKFIKKVFGITLLVYFASICLVYLVSSKQFHYQETQSDTVSQSQVVGEFAEGDTIKQLFNIDSEYLEGITVIPATFGKTVKGELEVIITDTKDKKIADINVDMSDFSDNQPYYINFPQKIRVTDTRFLLKLICKSIDNDTPISFYYGDSVKMAKGEITKTYDDSTRVYFSIPVGRKHFVSFSTDALKEGNVFDIEVSDIEGNEVACEYDKYVSNIDTSERNRRELAKQIRALFRKDGELHELVA